MLARSIAWVWSGAWVGACALPSPGVGFPSRTVLGACASHEAYPLAPLPTQMRAAADEDRLTIAKLQVGLWEDGGLSRSDKVERRGGWGQQCTWTWDIGLTGLSCLRNAISLVPDGHTFTPRTTTTAQWLVDWRPHVHACLRETWPRRRLSWICCGRASRSFRSSWSRARARLSRCVCAWVLGLEGLRGDRLANFRSANPLGSMVSGRRRRVRAGGAQSHSLQGVWRSASRLSGLYMLW